MKIKFLGTGTSCGIPELACDCHVCTSTNPKNRRLRSSVLIEKDGKNILIDAGPDLREQFLQHDIRDIDFVLLTHKHADHIMGLDDLRSITMKRKKKINVYSNEDCMKKVRSIYDYIEFAEQKGGGLPNLKFFDKKEDFHVNGTLVEPINVWHGKLNIFAYKIGDFAYLTDVKSIDKHEADKIKGIDTLVLNSLRFRRHSTHLNLSETLQVIDYIKPRVTYLTHICHLYEHEILEEILPDGVFVAYDGLEIEVE